MKRCQTAFVAASVGLLVATACSAQQKAADQASVLEHVPARLVGSYRIAKTQFEEIDGRVTTRWTPNELDVSCTTNDNDTFDIFVLRGVLGHRPDQPPRVPLDGNVPAFVDVVRTAAYRWDSNQHNGKITADERLPDWMTAAIVRWIFMIPQPPATTTSVGSTWTARVVLPKGSALAGEPYDVVYTLSKIDRCTDPDGGRCASIAFVATSVPAVPPFARFGTTVRGTVRTSLDGALMEVRATVRYLDSVTVEEWAITSR